MIPKRIFLVGLSGCGKSTVGRLVAERLGWEFADSDDAIEALAGRAIPAIFAEDGESKFREIEAEALASLSQREPLVIATGGGAITNEDSRRAIGHGFVVWMSVSPAQAAARLRANPATAERPLLTGDVEAKLTALHEARVQLYRQADAAIDVDELSPEQAASEVIQLWEEWRSNPSTAGERFFAEELQEAVRPRYDIAATVTTPLSSYPVVVQDGAISELGGVCAMAGLGGRAFVVIDEQIAPLFAESVQQALSSAGYRTAHLAVPSGEEQKTLGTVSRIYDWLISSRVERSDFVVCVGGGVLTDMAGFAAATCLRGIDFVHVPTSLLGMVDAAIGGKTGVDHPRGKNLIGAFAQPRVVVIDPQTLQSLPERHLRNGWAEVVKHGFILDEPLVRELEAVAADPSAMMSSRLIGWSVSIKANIVSEDEREAGRRTLLNYGHTIGHAIEAVTGYSTYLHGEAVAIGMRAAGLIALELGLLAADDFERQQSLIRAAGLPESAPGVSVEAVLQAAMQDKKVRAGSIHWVLLERIGHAVVRDSVPADVVRRAVETVLA
ncbi:MAG: 3-dehydroquinate synthase [Tepidiformaceae bacterium]